MILYQSWFIVGLYICVCVFINIKYCLNIVCYVLVALWYSILKIVVMYQSEFFFVPQGCVICLTLALGWALAAYVRYEVSSNDEQYGNLITFSLLFILCYFDA